MSDHRPVGTLGGSATPLAESFDVALLDLDGVIYRGADPVPRAAEALQAARDAGMRLAFVTNNALRPPDAVAEKLNGMDVPADVDDVVTSAQAAARMLAERLDEGSRVLVTGGAGLRQAVAERGLVPVDGADDDPAAVVQGYDPELTYARLCEAALAIRAGRLWIASNLDSTVPAERGLLPGAGSFVALLRTATDRAPLVAGKPERALHEESIRRTGAERPLVVGDRLDTDIEGAVRAGTPSLLVLTGVVDAAAAVAAPAGQRPTFLGADLRALLQPAPDVHVEASSAVVEARCGAWCCRAEAGALSWHNDADPDANTDANPDANPDAKTDAKTDADDGLDPLRAACAAAWAAADAGNEVRSVEGDVPESCRGLFADDC
ncbi:MAG: glycerol-phosphatase [Frankiaceae bacterium]|nr:glycerol-phosphatase [Frankiaceae bacterium]